MVHCHKSRAFCWSKQAYSVVVVLHQWTGAYQGRPLGQQPCHPCKPLLSRFGSAQQTASGIGELQCTHHASRWCNLAIRDCTLNLTLKRPINLWAVFIWAFIGWNCNLRDSTLSIQPGVNCHPHFHCVNYSKPWKKNTRSRQICRLLKGHGRGHFFKNYLGAAVRNRGGWFYLL